MSDKCINRMIYRRDDHKHINLIRNKNVNIIGMIIRRKLVVNVMVYECYIK